VPRHPIGGAPPEEHRCQAKRKGGKKCGKWALKGSRFCQLHGGRRRTGNVVHIGHLPVFYSSVLNATLTEAVQAATDGEPHEQLQVFEELALMRLAARDAVALWSAAQQSDNTETRLGAAEVMKGALVEVIKMAETAARINAAGSDKVSVHNIAHVVRQIVRIAYECMEEDQARVFERMVKQQIKLSTGAPGTVVTPDMDVRSMDDSIPAGDGN